MKNRKTNAMRILEREEINYGMLTYDKKDDLIDGISVAKKIDREVHVVFKTLIVKGTSGQLYVFVIPVAEELDLKKVAQVAKEKKVEMIAVKDIVQMTGYIRGGCSPIGMKKAYPTCIHESAATEASIVVSAGRIGAQIELDPEDLREITQATYANIIK